VKEKNTYSLECCNPVPVTVDGTMVELNRKWRVTFCAPCDAAAKRRSRGMLIRAAALPRSHAQSWEPAPPHGTVAGAHRLKLVFLWTSEGRPRVRRPQRCAHVTYFETNFDTAAAPKLFIGYHIGNISSLTSSAGL
jgi:hypothetical protein